MPHSLPNNCIAGELDPKVTQTVRDAVTLVPAPLTSDDTMPLEGPGRTGDDLVTDQEVTASMNQPREAPSRTPGRGTGITAPQ